MARPRPPASPRPTRPVATTVAGAQPRRADARRTNPARAAADPDWRRDAETVRLTEKLHAMVEAHAKRSTEALVQIGKQLARIFVRLEAGQWARWLDDNASFGRSSAQNYMKLAAWAEREPTQFARLRHLGPAKLYVLAGARRERVRGLKLGKAVDVPGTGKRKTVETMTPVELARLVVDDLQPPVPPKEKIDEVVRRVRSRLEDLATETDAMIERADEMEEAQLRAIRNELAAVLGRIDGALEG